jgi:hypothetical protein
MINVCSPYSPSTISCSKVGVKGSRELRRLSCSINYEANSGSASRGRVKGGLSVVIYEAQVAFMECKRVE